MFRLLIVALLVPALRAGIVDRIAVTVGQQVITELQLDEEIRVTAFLNHKPIVRDLETRRAAADRLIEQLLVKREMDLSHYPLPDDQDVAKYLEQVESDFPSGRAFQKALADDRLSDNTLRDHLALQLTTMRFVELRFRPDSGSANTDQVLEAWLEESRKQINIVYLDKSLR